MRALIVDSSKSFRTMLASVISDGGLDVVQVETGKKALGLLQNNRFDLVCVSMFLDDMDGVIFSSYLREEPLTKHIPLIMVTASEDQRALEKAIAIGVTEVFSKKNLDAISTYVDSFVAQHGQADRVAGRVLYVEDSQSVAAMTMAMLETHGLEVDHFIAAEEAYEAFQKTDYDIVLTDVVLEGRMNGVALVRALRSLDSTKARVPILAVSGFDDAVRKIELLRSGANDYVSKPTLDEELLARITNLLINKQLLDRIEAQQARLHDMAMRDQLTGLYNRHFLMEMAPSKISEAFRHKFPCSLVMLDADKFKDINDTHGHAAGDIVLQELAGVMADACRREDIAARFGGEEFVLLLSHCSAADAVKKADLIRQTIEALRPAGLKITASFGVAEIDLSQRCEFDDLFKSADEAVYEAKSSGRNKVVLGQAVRALTDEQRVSV